jgi:hypothetical protein
LAVLPKRFERFKLSLHPEKTRLIAFSRPKTDDEARERDTFDFLGFTFQWAKSRKGYWVIKKTTARKRKSRFMKHLWRWCKANRHKPIGQQQEELSAKLRGFYQYFGISGNYKALDVIHSYAYCCWVRWLSRRSSKALVRFDYLRANHALPRPRIVHRYPTLHGLHSYTPGRRTPAWLHS